MGLSIGEMNLSQWLLEMGRSAASLFCQANEVFQGRQQENGIKE